MERAKETIFFLSEHRLRRNILKLRFETEGFGKGK